MTADEADAILGPELCARIDALVEAAPPLTDEQIDFLDALSSHAREPQRDVA